jgi:hypothetical protein
MGKYKKGCQIDPGKSCPGKKAKKYAAETSFLISEPG